MWHPLLKPGGDKFAAVPVLAKLATSATSPSLRVAQVKWFCTPITADDYDALLRTRPWECSPAAIGDFRSGRQLLRAAAADDVPLETVLRTRRGRAAIGYLAGVLSRAIGDLRPLPPPPPNPAPPPRR
jgi:hypothetical protein